MKTILYRVTQGIPLKLDKDKKRLIARNYELYLFVLPALAYYIIFYYLPMYGVQIAFKDFMPTMGITGSPWVGLKHFIRFVSSYQFKDLFFNTISLSFYSLVVGFPMPILLALMMNELKSRRFKSFVQTVTYAPNFISMVVMVGMLNAFLSPSIGFINHFIEIMGGTTVDFMAKAEWFRPIYIISGIWQRTGWNLIIYMSALAAIDVELHEAAEIDGASRLKLIWHINIPGILPTVVILLILNLGQVLNVGFEKAFLMHNALNLRNS